MCNTGTKLLSGALIVLLINETKVKQVSALFKNQVTLAFLNKSIRNVMLAGSPGFSSEIHQHDNDFLCVVFMVLDIEFGFDWFLLTTGGQ